MSLLLSDPGLENPILWNFGKLEVKFSKPLDPSNVEESYKNYQKPKQEHTFAPEEHRKTSIVSNFKYVKKIILLKRLLLYSLF